MRVKSISFVSLVVIVASLAWVAGTALMGEIGRTAMWRPDLSPRLDTFEKQVKERPRDAKAWFALAVATSAKLAQDEANEGDEAAGKAEQAALTQPPPQAGELRMRTAFQRAIELKPDWAAPYLVFGALLVARVPSTRQDTYVAIFGERSSLKATTLSASHRADIRVARQALEKARSLQPANAAPDYLLAYLAFAERRDEDALALLRGALRRNRWDVGQRDAGIALYEAYAPAMPPFGAGVVAFANLFAPRSVHAPLRELARIITGMAVTAQQRGDDERAIFLRESGIHLGRVMAAQGYTIIDVLTGRAVWVIATTERLSPVEAAAATKGVRKPRPDEPSGNESPWGRALRTAKLQKLEGYLRAHGRGDLAGSIASFETQYTEWSPQVHKAMAAFTRRLAMSLLGPVTFLAVFIGGLVGVMVLLLCFVTHQVLERLGRRPAPITWARWKWALLVLGGAGLSVIMAVTGAPKEPPIPWTAILAMVFPAVTIPGVIVAVVAVTLLVRRGVDASQRSGFGRQYVGTLTAVMLPVTALLLVTAVALLADAGRGMNRFVEHQKIVIYQGELAYHGLKPPVGP